MKKDRKKYLRVKHVAAMFGQTPEALRAWLRRQTPTMHEGREVVRMGASGLIAFKFGRTWRFEDPTSSTEAA